MVRPVTVISPAGRASGCVTRGPAWGRSPAGRAAADWRLNGSTIEIEPFSPLADADVAALARDGDAVKRFLGIA
jgi:hypothetical protein